MRLVLLFGALSMLSAPVFAQGQDPQSHGLFQLKLAQAVDDRCKLMPGELRRDFDRRIARLENGAPQGLAAEAARRVEASPPKCDTDTQRFLQQSVATAQRLAP